MITTTPRQNIIVQVSDARISSDPASVLVTYSLGSCIAVAVYDPALPLGGMIHFQLPESSMDPERARKDPFMFADSGLEVLLNKMVQMGGSKSRFIVKIAGGASMKTGPKGFDIGKRNFLAVRKVFWQHGLLLKGQDCGGSVPRNLYLRIQDGAVVVKANGTEKAL